ncbi:DUF2911 domain-containing protein [Emticicia sp. C21]|uniref:DUF2911 domain-containing protein n=1 Tax=Emticicia sp. C21 TaxID=2302915 RepID=UPI000E346553|nr:DUF2911 domain-containing protein [Emticicia sp. C21]RFS15031.1 DUF2911 domain-containing protein [Emticicia sp. C21]
MKNNKQTITLLFTALVILSSLITSCNSKENTKQESKVKYKHDEPYAQKVNDGSIANDDYIGSIQRTSVGKVDSLRVRINYGSPGVRKRTIWGKLVPYDSLWVTGANTATSIEFSEAVHIEGRKIPAGKYALFTIPGRKEWTIIFNKDFQQHLTDDYDQKKDVTRFLVKPDSLVKPVLRLTYTIEKVNASTVEISMAWEKLKISFSAEVEK